MNNEDTSKKNRYKIIAISIGLLLIAAGALFYFGLKPSKAPSQDSLNQANQIEVTLKINTGQKTYQYQEKINKDASVLDLIKQSSVKEGFALEIKDSSMGAFIEGIWGVKNDTQSNKFWTFLVNGKFSNFGVSLYKLSNGDVVEWVYGNM